MGCSLFLMILPRDTIDRQVLDNIVFCMHFHRKILPSRLCSHGSIRRMSKKAFIALGSNVGDRVLAIHQALEGIKASTSMRLLGTSYLYETPPMYVTTQPSFLNAACAVETSLSSVDLLKELKTLESSIGRQASFSNGPRLIDLDIVMVEDEVLASPILTLPHPRMQERAFVLLPLHDLDPMAVHPIRGTTVREMLSLLPATEMQTVRRVFPLGKHADGSMAVVDFSKKVFVMGILNTTPDSFSDGGRYVDTTRAMPRVREMFRDGAEIIDIGGESTRPGATAVPAAEQLARILPIIRHVRQEGLPCILSVDTRSAEVARAAVEAGADLINDVSGGGHDRDMLSTAAALRVPLIFMHMRGDPHTMTTLSRYNHVLLELQQELSRPLRAAGPVLPLWMQYIDPGIGFAKTAAQNLTLLKPENLKSFTRALQDRPLLVGASRKRFVREIVSTSQSATEVEESALDAATVATSCAAVYGGASIVRVHEVKTTRLACDTMRAIRDASEI
uniref:Dihydropteroate synthase n=1 Tax=Kremastochrysopsis austriaca TaxID=2600099 RepID=A0A5P5XJV1_9STRA|nr:dihydropteroate synthase [Kremastochrysopsis austriaca]